MGVHDLLADMNISKTLNVADLLMFYFEGTLYDNNSMTSYLLVGENDGGRFQQPTYSMKPKQEDEAMGAHLGQIKPKFMYGRSSPNLKGCVISNLGVTLSSVLRLRRFKMLWKVRKKIYNFHVWV